MTKKILYALIIINLVLFGISSGIAAGYKRLWQMESILPLAQGMTAIDMETGESYLMKLGLGCMPALLDPPTSIISIHSTKFFDITDPYDNGDVGLLFFKTKFRKSYCKIIFAKKI